ncbi:hypothetical protein Tco_0983261 [Tanacetum coccineum]
MPTEMELTLEQTQQGVSYEVSNIRVNSFTMKMEILLEPTSNKLMVGRSSQDSKGKLKDGGVSDEVLKSKNFKYIVLLYRDVFSNDEVLKLKNFKKDATLKLSKSTNQEWYEHVGLEVTRSQDDKVTRWQNEIMLG